MKKRVVDIVMEVLINNDITSCFCVVGGGAMHLDNALLKCEKMNKIFTHHEQACSMAAEGYARMSGKMAAVCVTSGPGGTNAINGVQGAWVDSIPMIIISGFPRWTTSALSTGLDIRVSGVQENDIVRMVSGITKYSKTILNPYDIRMEMQYAIDSALDGRRGPSWINIPLDIQALLVDEKDLSPVKVFRGDWKKDIDTEMQQLNAMIRKSERPCILTGSGIRTGDCWDEFTSFTKKVGIPVVGGYLQSDLMSAGEENFYGMAGTSGGRSGNFIIQNSDLIIVLGNSLSNAQTGYNKDGFAPFAKMVMVDAQRDESKKPGLHIDLAINTDLKTFFSKGELISEWRLNEEWICFCKKCYNRFQSLELLNEKMKQWEISDEVPQRWFWKKIFEKADTDAIFSLGASGSIMGGLETPVEKSGQRVLANYNCGSMGIDLPYAVGAYMASRKEVYCITGDGSVMMNIQELETISYNEMPIKVVIFSNDGYSAIRNTCKRFFNGEHIGCDPSTGLGMPDFSKIAYAFDFPYKKCANLGELDEALEWLVHRDGRCILEIVEPKEEIGVPGVASVMDEEGRFVTPPIHVMSPLLPTEEIEKWVPRHKEIMQRACSDERE